MHMRKNPHITCFSLGYTQIKNLLAFKCLKNVNVRIFMITLTYTLIILRYKNYQPHNFTRLFLKEGTYRGSLVPQSPVFCFGSW